MVLANRYQKISIWYHTIPYIATILYICQVGMLTHNILSCIPHDRDTSRQNFFAINIHQCCKKIHDHNNYDTLKIRTKTTVTPSVFCQQPSRWPHHVAAIAAHSPIPHIVVTTTRIKSCSLRSSRKVAYLQHQSPTFLSNTQTTTSWQRAISDSSRHLPHHMPS